MNETTKLAERLCEMFALGDVFRYFLRKIENPWEEIRLMALDRIDIAILEVLQKDGRISNRRLRRRWGSPSRACSRRLDNLEKSGVVKGYHAGSQMQPLDMRYGDCAYFAVGTVRADAQRVRSSRAALSECGVLPSDVGRVRLYLRIAARDLQDYERVHKEWLTGMPHVIKINSAFALREVVDRDRRGAEAADGVKACRNQPAVTMRSIGMSCGWG